MVRRPALPPLSELPVLEDDPALFDPSPEWFVPGLKPSHREEVEEDEGLGLRALIEQPEALSKAWRVTTEELPVHRAPRAKVLQAGRPRRWPHAA